MKQNPLVSVIINCYNGEKYLRETIDSVIAQSYTNWEIIFWDNQSTDSTADIVKSYEDGRVKYFYASEHTSLGEARNLAMKKSQGEYIGFLDADDVWFPTFLERITRVFNQSDIGLVYSRFIFFNEAKEWPSIAYRNEGFVPNMKLIESYNIGMSAAMFRASLLEKYNVAFDEQFSLIEDFDFFIRIALCCKTYFIDEFLMKYRCHSNNLSLSNKWIDEFDILLTKSRENSLLYLFYKYINRRKQIYEYQLILKTEGRFKAFLYSLFHVPTNVKMVKYMINALVGRDIFAGLRSIINKLN